MLVIGRAFVALIPSLLMVESWRSIERRRQSRPGFAVVVLQGRVLRATPAVVLRCQFRPIGDGGFIDFLMTETCRVATVRTRHGNWSADPGHRVTPVSADVTIRGDRLARGECLWTLLCAIAGVSALACAQREPTMARVPRESVTGRAAVAAGDSGIFASPVLPPGVGPVIPHADAESAAVAMGYWSAPSVQDRTVTYYHEIPTEPRVFCGRSYFVRPVVAMPDTAVVRSNSGNDWMMWAATWVMPICDDKGLVRTSVHLADVTPGLRVIQGSGARDVPELVPDSGTFPHIGQWRASEIGDWERGIGITPESAVAVAAAALFAKTGARIAEVPEAFTIVRLLEAAPPLVPFPRIVAALAICPRWRLTLDRPVPLRGATSGQVVRTQRVYVTRGAGGCRGAPLLQVPTPKQPATVPFMYNAGRPPLGS